MVNEVEETNAEETTAEPLKGRAALMAMYKTRNPETSDEPDEDTLFDFAGKGYSDHDELKGRYDKLNGANETLAGQVAEVPLLARWLSGISNGENPWKHLGAILGPKCENLDEKSIEQLKAGQAQFNERFKKIDDNFKTYEKDLADYASENELPKEMVDEIDDTIMDISDAFSDRVIPKELIKLVHEALAAPAKIAEAEQVATADIEAAKVAGANEAIEQMKGKKAEATPVPDIVANKGSNQSKMPKYTPKVVNMADDFKEKE
jgi:hypothetical protein